MGTLRGLRSYVTGLWSSMRNAKAAPVAIPWAYPTSSVLTVREWFRSQPTGDHTDFGPLAVCPCGSDLFLIIASFNEEGALATYFTEARCVMCNADVTVITEVDVE